MNERDANRLRDMLDAARNAIAFAEGKSRQSLDDNLMFAYALVRAVEIVGEAATKITDATRDSYPEIPWKNIIGMRNRIVHDYNNVDDDILWKVVTDNLPPLITQIESILRTLDKDNGQ